MISVFNYFEWGARPYFLLLIPFLFIVLVCVHKLIRTQRVACLLAHTRLSLFTVPFSSVRTYMSMVLVLLGFLFLVLALVRPRIFKEEAAVPRQVRDIFVLLDISRSMLAGDGPEGMSRLSTAKNKIKEFLLHTSTERIGLILFSSSAFVHCPLTADHETFNLFLDAVDAELVSSGATAIDQALKRVLTAFDSAADRKSRLVFLITDGEDFSTNLSDFRRQAREKNLILFACGVGSVQGAPIPVLDERGQIVDHMRDQSGAVVISRLNEPMLRDLTTEFGGRYIAADQQVDTILAGMQRVEKESIEEKNHKRFDELHPYFSCGALACFLLESFL